MTVLARVAPDTSPNAPSPVLSKPLAALPAASGPPSHNRTEVQPSWFHFGSLNGTGFRLTRWCPAQDRDALLKWDEIRSLERCLPRDLKGKGSVYLHSPSPPPEVLIRPPLPPGLDSNDRLATPVS